MTPPSPHSAHEPSPAACPVIESKLPGPTAAFPAALAENVGSLLDRMRSGDRAAAAEFMAQYGARIRRRVRGKLSPAMRRLFDSQDILSTLGRRLDLYVRAGRLRAVSENELWSLVFTVADHALVDLRRTTDYLRSIEGADGPLAQAMLRRINDAPEPGADASLGLARVFEALKDGTDREILSLWITDTPHHVTAELMGLTPAAVRKRWERIKDTLREDLKAEYQ
jgi:DNA-directed RNA polymerase specialized sigma24 family protein